jgi:tetratricopeptide (TPR) repeat protein
MRLIQRAPALLLVLALAAHLPSYADWKGNAASQALSKEADDLYSRGKIREALDKYQAAAAADPATSYPVALIANAVYLASNGAKGEERVRLRAKAEEVARAALKLEPANPIAQETLRKLLDDGAAPLRHIPTRTAELALSEGENLFQRGDYDGALQQYELALARDPLYALAWVDAGDCYYVQKHYAEAELRFRQATELEPMLGQAWRFLSDALLQQGKRKAGEAALYGGIAAQPSQLPNWDKLALLWRGDGLPLKRLSLVPRASATLDVATKQINVTVTAAGAVDKNDPDIGVWVAYASSRAISMHDNGVGGTTQLSPFQIELKAWRHALKVAAQVTAAAGAPPRDAALTQMLELDKTSQLEAAILLLLYRESYRAEFEAWKAAHPDGIRLFVASTGLRP